MWLDFDELYHTLSESIFIRWFLVLLMVFAGSIPVLGEIPQGRWLVKCLCLIDEMCENNRSLWVESKPKNRIPLFWGAGMIRPFRKAITWRWIPTLNNTPGFSLNIPYIPYDIHTLSALYHHVLFKSAWICRWNPLKSFLHTLIWSSDPLQLSLSLPHSHLLLRQVACPPPPPPPSTATRTHRAIMRWYAMCVWGIVTL